jgi:NAD(P)-dependent dehydrogenase (short-subunit alcohol dehydrogenase family)
MDLQLVGKKALLTGSTAGVGLATARGLYYLPGMSARNWDRVVFVSRESGVQVPAEMIHYAMRADFRGPAM